MSVAVHEALAPTVELDHYTDPAAMQALLQSQLPGFATGRLRIDALAIDNVRRNTSRTRNPSPMSLCYHLQVHDRVSGRLGTQILFAQVFRAGLSAEAFEQHDPSALVPPPFGEALVHLSAANLLLWALPNDPGLPHLARLLDPVAAVQALPLACDALRGRPLRVEMLRYAPQRRATLRYSLDGEDGRSSRVLYAKTFCDQRAFDIHARFAHFWRVAQADPQAPLVAEPLGVDAATRSVWQAPAAGVPLRALLAAADGPLLMGRVAEALAALHAAPLPPSRGTVPRSVPHWLAEVRRRRQKIERIDPALGERAARIADAITAHAAHPAARPQSLIHGDCHPDQFWVHNGRIVMFDFDEFSHGEPMEDLAAFMLKLEQAGLPGSLAAAFVARYATVAPARFDARTLAWHLAIQSLLQVSRTFIYQQAGWSALLEHRLVAAERRAAALRAGGSA